MTLPSGLRIFAASLALLCALAACSAAAEPGCCTKVDFNAHERWLVNARCAPFCGDMIQGAQKLKFFHYQQGRWEPSTREAFLASDAPGVPTCFAIHGNRTDPQRAQSFGRYLYRRLAERATAGQTFRLVTWSWPSEQIRGLRKDILVKEQRADAQGFYVAWLIDQITPTVPVTLVGYSHGSQTTTTALTLLAGGSFRGYHLEERVHPHRTPLRAVLMAAALNNNGLLPGHPFGPAISQIDKLLLMYNPCDPALKWYPLIERCRRPQAMGYTGIACPHLLGDDREKIHQLNVGAIVDGVHDWRCYLGNRSLGGKIAPYVFREDELQQPDLSDPPPQD